MQGSMELITYMTVWQIYTIVSKQQQNPRSFPQSPDWICCGLYMTGRRNKHFVISDIYAVFLFFTTADFSQIFHKHGTGKQHSPIHISDSVFHLIFRFSPFNLSVSFCSSTRHQGDYRPHWKIVDLSPPPPPPPPHTITSVLLNLLCVWIFDLER